MNKQRPPQLFDSYPTHCIEYAYIDLPNYRNVAKYA